MADAIRPPPPPPAKERKPTGRPTRLTPELQATILGALQEGAYIATACALVAVDEVVFYRWMRMGKDRPGSVFGAFRQAVKRALAFAEIEDLRAVKAGRQNWQARAWRLERRWPARYGRRVEVASVVNAEMARTIRKLKETLDGPAFERVLASLADASDGLDGAGVDPLLEDA